MSSITRIAMVAGIAVYTHFALAEIFLTDSLSDSVYVGDHLLDGGAFVATREISAEPGIMEDPARVQVYTGTEPGSSEVFTNLIVCDRSDESLFLVPIDTEGNAGDALWYKFPGGSGPCANFLVHRSHYFLIGGNASRIEVYAYGDFGSSFDPNPPVVIKTLYDSFGFELTALAADADQIYALTERNEALYWDLGIDEDEVANGYLFASTTFPDACPPPWRALEASGGLLYLTAGTAPNVTLCVFDIVQKTLLRTLSHPLVQAPKQVAVSGDELFVLDETGIYTFNLGAGGPVQAKRLIETSEVEYIWVTQQPGPIEPTFELALEEPVDGAVHSGVGNLRGWAVATDGIARVDVFVDGELFQSAPYGGSRADVGGVFPEVADAGASGFSLAYNYGALDPGAHTIMARAETRTGGIVEASATFTATRPGQEFIPGADAVDLSGASCSISQGRSIRVEDITIDGGGPWDALLEWQPAAQAFEAQTYIFNADGI